jgi:hypothetical protein
MRKEPEGFEVAEQFDQKLACCGSHPDALACHPFTCPETAPTSGAIIAIPIATIHIVRVFSLVIFHHSSERNPENFFCIFGMTFLCISVISIFDRKYTEKYDPCNKESFFLLTICISITICISSHDFMREKFAKMKRLNSMNIMLSPIAIIPETWNNLEEFAHWFKSNGFPIRVPADMQVYVTEHSYSCVVFRQDIYQAELYMIAPNSIGTPHSHDFENLPIHMGGHIF